MQTSSSSPASDAVTPGSEPSPFATPSISLPKGGGAIRGIGEKFQANPATGTGKLTIPLPLSPGRSGFGPELSLSYDSGSGNNVFGIGWSLSVPSVTRKTDKGIPKYRRREVAECDVFILSGAEDLVPVLVKDETGRWIDDEFEAEGHRIKRYRPRIEGLFARIERWTRIVDGDEHWRSITKDNTLSVYGRNQNSRIADPGNHRHVFSWLVSENYDSKGNAIVYEYAAEDGYGVDEAFASERHRIRTANRYLKRIRYGNRIPILQDCRSPGFRGSHLRPRGLETADWMFEAVLDYGDEHYHAEAADADGCVFSDFTTQTAGQPKWPVRKDPFSRYRSGFEVRNYRLCQRVLMLHRFPEELGAPECLVRSTEFTYHQKAIGSFLTRATQSGYVRQGNGRYLKKSMPALQLDYTSSPLEDERYRDLRMKEVEPESLGNLPSGIDESTYKWIDLNGEGITGVLAEQGSAWYYKPNAGNGRFGATELVSARPSLAALNQGKQQLLDVAGDGTLNLVQFDSNTPGFYERTLQEGWAGFRTFHSLPVLDWKDPNLRFADVTGDGIADILITEDEAFLWHPSLLQEGFGPATRVAVPAEEGKGPHVIFADGVQSVYLADMSGDGLSDLVRIRNGEVCYWPNLGYGVFGATIVMDNAPWFADDDIFQQSRVKLADTDGSGPADIVYLGSSSIHIYLNQSGNSWSDARILNDFPSANPQNAVSVVDFLGRGTACLLWSSALPGDAMRALRYLDLMDGVKPHLLVTVINNLGAETRIEYASSTEFYLADKAAGKPWLTRLPFSVYTVKRVETYDFVSRNRFVSSYTYHHGFFDGLEREFRGFGRVEQLDTEQFATLGANSSFPAATNEAAASNVPPVLTKTWFHTGVFLGNGRVARHLAQEYYREPIGPGPSSGRDPLAAMLLDDSILPDNLTAEEAREACRSLKGSLLRQEIYGLDDREASGRPYIVTESNSTITTLQRRGHNLHAVFFTHPREAVTFHYERKLYTIDGVQRADPRVTHTFNLEVDGFGNVLQSVDIAYGRRFPDSAPILTDPDHDKQRTLLLTCRENRYTNAVLEVHAYRTPLPADSRKFELIHMRPPTAQTGITNLFRFESLKSQIACAGGGFHDLPFEDVDAAGATHADPYRRLLEDTRTFYRADSLDRILPLGILEPIALPGKSYKLAFTPGLLSEVYRRDDEDLLPDLVDVLQNEGKYVDLTCDGRWWVSSGRIFYSSQPCDASVELEQARSHFFLPRRFLDAFENPTIVHYDPHNLVPIQIRDAVDNATDAEIDYRVLSPHRMMDANRNRSAVAFDALGLVVGTAVMGKPGQRAGDSLDDFDADLDDAIIREHLAHPLLNPHAVLRFATSRLIYDLFAYIRTREAVQPQAATVYTVVRETHAADLGPHQHTRMQHSFSYSDGFGREIQKKSLAEPGPLTDDGPTLNPRWIGSGWAIFNNKGKAVRKYEPFFTAAHIFEFANITGVSSILCYDPVQRVVATIHPNHSYEKIVFDPWCQQTWDTNDTVLEQNPAHDADVGNFFAKLPPTDYLPTWYSQRIHCGLGAAEQHAASKTAVHANTPSVAYADSLGRTFLSVAHNRYEQAGALIDQYLTTRTQFDIQNNQRAVIDALGRTIMRYDYNVLTSRLRQISVDAQTRWMLNDSLGKLLLSWDSRMHRFRHQYDALRRPTNFYVRIGHHAEILAERVVYGEGQPNDLAHNLRMKAFLQFDGAGVVTAAHYDFKGNLLQGSRQLLQDYKHDVDWSQPPELETATFHMATSFDALNRPIAITTPDASVTRPRYNESSLLESLTVNLRGEPEATSFVTYIKYNAKGRRKIIDYGNGAHTRYTYDPLTFRMVHLLTRRKHDDAGLQNLHYVFDPVGNISSICDEAQETIYFKNQVVSASNDYIYDAIYRLISADGRELAGKPDQPQTTSDDLPRMNQPLPSDGHALHRYREQYDYDPVGNILRLLHSSVGGRWSRIYAYEEANGHPINNRLTNTRVGDYNESYGYDAAGNMTHMPHLPYMESDFKDHLHATRRQVTHDGRGETTYYVYDSAGQRVRKVTERASGSRMHERTYLGSFEIYRKYNSVEVSLLERETLHIMDDRRRIALVETKTVDEASSTNQQPSRLRFQFDNHLGSAVLELDDQAAIITYEEFYPYGSTSYEANNASAEVSRKRYRYTGKERDEETGFYYNGARYYAPWFGRWTAADPKGIGDGPNPYAYTHANPIGLVDPRGTDDTPPRQLNDVVPYSEKLQNRAAIGHNVQKDHVIAQAKIKDMRTDPSGTVHYDPHQDPTVVVETGKARGGKPPKPHTQKTFHDPQADVKEIKRLRQDGVKSISGDIVEPSRQAAIRSGMKPEAVDKAIGGQLDNLHSSQTLQETAAELERLEKNAAGAVPVAPSVAPPVAPPVAPVADTSAKEVVKVGTEEVVEGTSKTGFKEGAKLVGEKAAKYAPFVGVAVGVGLVGHDLYKGDYGAAAWDATEAIPGVGDAVGIFHLVVIGAESVPQIGADMYEGQRQSDVKRFEEQNPGAPPQAFGEMQKLQENWDTGQF